MGQGPKRVGGTFWFLIGFLPSWIQDDRHFQSRLLLCQKSILANMVKLYIVRKEI